MADVAVPIAAGQHGPAAGAVGAGCARELTHPRRPEGVSGRRSESDAQDCLAGEVEIADEIIEPAGNDKGESDDGDGAAWFEVLRPPRLDPADRDGIRRSLDEHGFCVVASVADAEEVATAKRLMWDWLEEGDPDGEHVGHGDPRAGLSRGDASTWGNETWAKRVTVPITGIIGGGGIGHSAFAWHVRTLPAVRRVFEGIWDTKRLISSFDGGCAFRPWEERHEWRTRGGWLHVDQGPTKPGRCCVQGLVTLTDADEHTGGLVVVDGSHQDFADVMRRNAHSNSDFVMIHEADETIVSRGTPKLLCAKAGDLLLWDSRTVHCSTPGVWPPPRRPGTRPELLRIASYVCMTPAAWASEETLARRRRAFVHKQTSSHWPHWFASVGDGLVDASARAGALEQAPPEVRSLVDGGEDDDAM